MKKTLNYSAYAARTNYFYMNGFIWIEYIDQGHNVIHTKKFCKSDPNYEHKLNELNNGTN